MSSHEYQQLSRRWRAMLRDCLLNDVIKEVEQYIQAHCDEINNFYGIGNMHDSEVLFSQDRIECYFQGLQTNSAMDNPFDLLSLLAQCGDDYQQVIHWYLRVLNQHPLCYQLHYGLGNAYFNTFKARLSESHYRQAVKINPRFCQGYIGLAWIQVYRYFRFHKAMLYAEVALALNKDSIQAKLIKAGFHPSIQYSLKILQELKSKYPNNSMILCAQGFRLAVRNSNKSSQIYKQIIQKDPKCIVAYFYLSKLMGFKGNKQEAFEYLHKGLQINPKSYFLYLQLGSLYYMDDQYGQALNYLKKCLNINEEDIYSLYLSGCIYRDNLPQENREANNQIAKNYFKKCIQYNPYYFKAYSKLKRIYQQQGLLEQLSSLLFSELQARIETSDPNTLHDVAELALQILYRRGFDNNIRNTVFQLIKVCPYKVQLSQLMASKFLEKSLAYQSIRYIRFCLQIKPLNLNAIRIHAEALQQAQRWKQSINQYISYLQLQSQKEIYSLQKDVHQRILIILKKLELDEAVGLLEKFIVMFEDCLVYSQILADYYQKSDRFESALNLYNKIESFALYYRFQDQEQRDKFFGMKTSKWRALNSKGIYTSRQEVNLKKIKLLFKIKYYELLKC